MDEIDNSVIASTTVPINSDISQWLNNLEIPVHEGHRFDRFDITAGDIHNVTGDATVYIRYSVGATLITGYVNDGGDIIVECVNYDWNYTESADIVITFSKNFDTVDYNSHEVYDLSATGEEVSIKSSTIEGKKISFTDDVINNRNLYRIDLFKDGQKVDKTAWDAGFKPTFFSITQNGKTKKYTVFA